MKIIKTGLIITIVMLSASVYSQTPSTMMMDSNNSETSSLDFKLNYFDFSFGHSYFQKTQFQFSRYNPTTTFNDNYLLLSNNYVAQKSNVIFENNFRGHKIDSFNPHGATSIPSALLMGVMSTLFK